MAKAFKRLEDEIDKQKTCTVSKPCTLPILVMAKSGLNTLNLITEEGLPFSSGLKITHHYMFNVFKIP
jgi:hypothetical protein